VSDHNDTVRRSFERQVPLFSGAASPFAQRSGSLAWIEPLEADDIVLDVACGAAHASEPVAAAVRQVVGVDITPALLAVGAQRLRDNGIANVLLQEGDAHALPFVDNSFDIVCCRSSMHHFSDPHAVLAEMARVCRPGGRVVVTDLVVPIAEARDRYDDLHRLIDPSHVRAFTERELAAAMPGGIDTLTYADTGTIRLPIDIAFSEQSHSDDVLGQLRAELNGTGEATGFEPEVGDGDAIVVSFVTCTLHAPI
jgi:ubiquinone/menaquinone biosynthesis C-methylase UbiE